MADPKKERLLGAAQNYGFLPWITRSQNQLVAGAAVGVKGDGNIGGNQNAIYFIIIICLIYCAMDRSGMIGFHLRIRNYKLNIVINYTKYCAGNYDICCKN